MDARSAKTRSGPAAPALDRRGALLVAASALIWSFGGAIARGIGIDDPWTIVFWRSVFAALFLFAFLLVRDGPAGLRLFREMGVPGLAVAVFFATASVAFVMAIQYTSIANVILIGAAVPLVAAVIGRVLFRTPVSRATWIAIAAVLAGVSVMVVGPDQTGGAALGNALAVLMTFAFAGATVVTRQYHGIRMTPAVCTAMILAASVAAANASGFAASGRDFALLFTFGALNLGLGMAFFVTGARLIPAALTALLGTAETVLQPIWVWLFHGEIPAARSLTGGAIVLVALVVHILLEARRSRPDGPTVPTPP